MPEGKRNGFEGRLWTFILCVVGILVALLVWSALHRLLQTFVGPESPHNQPVLRVEVLNGCGEPRLAYQVANLLRSKGFDVVSFGDAKGSNYASTVVVDNVSETKENARRLAAAIGCKKLAYEPAPSRYLDVTLIVGGDYERIFGKGIRDWP